VKFGAEPKKLAWLSGLIAVAGLIYYFQSSDSSSPAPALSNRVAVVAPQPVRVPRAQPERRRATNASLVKEWKPRQGFQNPEDRPDPTTIDPRLRMELLAKVQSVQAGAPGRNVFTFGAAPPPPAPPLPKAPPVIHVTDARPPTQGPTIPPGPPPPPPPPPITLKYYGQVLSKSDGHKAAFLLDGDDILIVGENDTLKRRYRIIRIGVNSITIEDTQFKNTQTLQLQENQAG
jgi:hypothetical protein